MLADRAFISTTMPGKGGNVMALDASFLKEKDKEGEVVGTWAEERKPNSGLAWCKVCNQEVNFQSGRRELLRHSMRGKHKDKVKSLATEEAKSLKQITLVESIEGKVKESEEQKEVKEKTSRFEIDLARSLSRHKISPTFLDCLQDILRKHCGDSVVVQKMKLGEDKGAYLVRYGIGKTYREETVELLRKCDAFSIGFDETEINKTSQMEVLVKLAHPKYGIVLRHYRTIELQAGNAEAVTNMIVESFNLDGVDFKKKLIAPMSDGCATMEGKKSGVKVRLSKEVDDMKDLGACNGHHISNAMKWGVRVFDEESNPEVEDVLVDLFEDIGGSKGKGTKKMKEFIQTCKAIGLHPRKIKKFINTRYRIYRSCLEPVIYNWEGLVKYYKEVKKPTDRQVRLQTFFVEQEQMSLLKVLFLLAATRELVLAIDFFEQRTELMHKSRAKMEEVLRTQILKFHDESAVKVTDEESNSDNVLKKTGVQLLEIDLENKETLLSKKKMFIGQETKKQMREIGLTPDACQMEWFFNNVFKFHKKVTARLIHYFKTALQSTDMEYMAALSPDKRRSIGTSEHLKYLLKSFSKVVVNIDEHSGADRLTSEIDLYTIDDDLWEIEEETTKMEYEAYWDKVGELQDGDWPRYPVLCRFAKALGTVFNSNSETERAFSVEGDIHKNPKKNLMDQDTLDCHMQVKYGVESKENKQACVKCVEKVKSHCHCSAATISDEMMKNCKEAWRQLKLDKEEDEEDNSAELTEKQKKEAEERVKKFREQVSQRPTFYPPSVMKKAIGEHQKAKKVDGKVDGRKVDGRKVDGKKVDGKKDKVQQGAKRGRLDKQQQGESSTERPGTRYSLVACCSNVFIA